MSDLSPDRLPEVPAFAGTRDGDGLPRVAALAVVEALPGASGAHPAATSLACGSASLASLPQAGGVGGGLATDAGTFTRERQAVFLEALAASGSVRSAAARAGVSHQTAYRARLASPVFARGWRAALLAARAQAEDVLATRAIDGVEEEVWYHGEVVATRQRYDSRLLLAHLARLDKLTAEAPVAAFAGDFEAAVARFAEGSDTPEKAPAKEPAEISPGQWSKRSTEPFMGWDEEDDFDECPECGGACLGPEDDLVNEDCQYMGNRLERMDIARPEGAALPEDRPGDLIGAVEMAQLHAFEAGAASWWTALPPEPGASKGVLYRAA